MISKLLGKKCFLQLEDGLIPDAILAASYNQRFNQISLLTTGELIIKKISIDHNGESFNNHECFGFKGIKKSNGGYYMFPSRYFQIERNPNHPLTKIFED